MLSCDVTHHRQHPALLPDAAVSGVGEMVGYPEGMQLSAGRSPPMPGNC